MLSSSRSDWPSWSRRNSRAGEGEVADAIRALDEALGAGVRSRGRRRITCSEGQEAGGGLNDARQPGEGGERTEEGEERSLSEEPRQRAEGWG